MVLCTRAARAALLMKTTTPYIFATIASLGLIYWLSSLPDLRGTEQHPVVALVSNLAHAPVFAGLAFCLLKALSADEPVSWRTRGLVLLGAAICAAMDEWHQSFVPGRHASVADFLLDLTGVVSMLLIVRPGQLRQSTP